MTLTFYRDYQELSISDILNIIETNLYTMTRKPGVHNYAKCNSCGKDLGYWASGKRDTVMCRECWKKTNRGENHPCWKKDLDPKKREQMENRSTDAYNNWEQLVKQRDNFTCVKCGVKDEHIAAHHIFDKLNYPDLIYNIDNGICLCKSCHTIFHSVYTNKRHGGSSSNPELLMLFLQEYTL